MPITVFKGLPGSGKSKRLIELVNAAAKQGRPTLTFLCSDFPWLMGFKPYVMNRLLQCRQPGPSCPLHHFVSTAECSQILKRTLPDTLVAIEEAQSFGPNIVQSCLDGSRRGIDLILVSASAEQLQQLPVGEYTEVNFPINCQKCAKADAVTVVVPPDSDDTVSVCLECFTEMAEAARQEILRRLRQELPHPGKEAVYQPVELPECAQWAVSRGDSERRAEIMMKVLREVGLLSDAKDGNPTYLDIGCNTGYFCNYLQRAGFYAKGIDAVKNNIIIAQLLDSFFRRQHRPNKKFVTYEAVDAYEYLRDSQQEIFDVVSAFSVFQWIMLQRSVEDSMACLDWFFAKARRLCVLEMGYTAEVNYRKQLKLNIDRDWVLKIMKEKGGFAEIRMFEIRVMEGGREGVSRDLFIGVRTATAHAATSKKVEPLCTMDSQLVTVQRPATKARQAGAGASHAPSASAEVLGAPVMITAKPNPVPTGAGPGSTTVSWDAGNASEGHVYVSVNSGEEKLFSAAPKGSREAPWINKGGVYEFRLYRGTDRKKLLGSVKVIREGG